MSSYDDLVSLMAGMQRVPHYTLKCHPTVHEALKRAYADAEREVPVATPLGFAGLPSSLLSMEIFEDPDMVPGEWVIKKDGVTIQSGVLSVA